MPKTFKHSGDLGDIIYSLPTVRALGGGVLFLDPNGGQGIIPHLPRTRLNAALIQSIRPLLVRQPYIQDVLPWAGEPIDYDLDKFRDTDTPKNISDVHLEAFGLPSSERDRAWLSVDDPITIPGRQLVINRTVRFQSNHTFWENFMFGYKNECVFVGLPKEHEIFVYTFEVDIPYYPTPDVLTLARVIAGSAQLIANQSLCHAIAQGLQHNLVCEVYQFWPNAVFHRPKAQYV